MRAIVLLVVSSLATIAIAQSPRGKVEVDVNGNAVVIDYGRPSLAGRDMLAKALVGTVWRMGADEATTIQFESIVVFGNMVVHPGAYSLFMKRASEENWMLVVNKQTGQWGTEHDPTQDLYAIPLKWEKQDASTEVFTIAIESETADTAILSVKWGNDVLKQRFRSPKLN